MAITIITTSLPNGTNGVAYSQTIQTTGGTAPFTFTVDTGSLPTGLSINASTGAITGTPSGSGVSTFTIKVVDNVAAQDTQSFTVQVYAPLDTAPDPGVGDTAVYVTVGDQIQFTSTGGSGNYLWSVDGGNLINPSSGLFTAVNGGSFTVTLVDTESGQTATVSVVVTSQSQFCVQGVQAAGVADASTGDPCCEYNVECGDRLQLKVPSFHVVVNGERQVVSYTNVVSAVTGDAAALQSTAVNAGATGNMISVNRDGYFEIVTSYDMAQVGNGEFGIGFSSIDTDTAVSTIEHAVVWVTNGGVRQVEIRHLGSIEASSQFDIAQGDAVTFGQFDGQLKLFINSVDVFTSAEVISACNEVMLDIAIADASKTIGGYVANLTWAIETAGSAGEVGAIDAGGIYTSPVSPIGGVVLVSGSINNATFFVGIRTIQPTPIYTKPQPFLAGRRAHVWVSNRKATDNEIIRIASDGSPDAIQNPGMIYLGVLEGSATFAEDNQTQDFTNDEGIYQTVITEERATLTGTFLEVRDLDKLALLLQHGTLHPKVKGVTEFSVGGKACGGCDLRAVLVVEAGGCGSGYDVIYMPRVQNIGNLSLEIGKKTNSKYALNFRVLPDVTRPAGKQLYSIYQLQNCGDIGESQVCD